jgi:YHS domain-containing protein
MSSTGNAEKLSAVSYQPSDELPFNVITTSVRLRSGQALQAPRKLQLQVWHPNRAHFDWEDAMAQDPVCNMDIDESKAEYISHYNGKKYYFCSDACKESFDKEPERYAANAA